jgi:uncharacterized protein YbcI
MGLDAQTVGDPQLRRTDSSVSFSPFAAPHNAQERGEKASRMSEIQEESAFGGAVMRSISNAAVRLLSEYTGRGPTKARTYVNDDLISIVLKDTMTTGERGLCRRGKGELVLSVRRAYQDTMGPALIAAVELNSGRRVLAFLSANHLDPDVAVESFVMGAATNGDLAELDGGAAERHDPVTLRDESVAVAHAAAAGDRDGSGPAEM